MIPVDEALFIAKDHAREMLTQQLYDADRDIPMRSTNHTDLWPGDRWVEAYLAIGEPGYAERVMATTLRSIRPDGSLPHLMQGSHRRGGIETRWIDRQVYRMQGNGAVELPNGEWVTKSYGVPTLALGAVALASNERDYPDLGTVARPITTLFNARANSEGLIEAHKVDELTNSAGKLAHQVKKEGKAVDPAVNALIAQSLFALKQHPESSFSLENWSKRADYLTRAEDISLALLEELQFARVANHRLTNEEVLALARLNDPIMTPSEHELHTVFEAPAAANKHPEHSNLTLAECLEIARLTHWADASHKYLDRVLPKIAMLGATGLTRFEDVKPGHNPAVNKYNRKQVWLPTAAEIVQIQEISL
jgi:hypothetical protein